MKNVNNSNTRLILLHPYIQKEYSTTTAASAATTTFPSTTTAYSNAPLPSTVINTLLHYSSKSNDSFRMSYPELKPISDVLRKCSSPCNFLVFGLTHETLLWKALNHHSQAKHRVDESHYAIR
ncbi:hypothetical protein EUGRSUZ_H02125 [Eucalyptus grandis]|uniref:Uncharacterized protein n=2 Tax=Eucalyptus grandis TaxID=71139 RepID=A0ACC3JQY6_EUCGR|nr:hypothetical protein EUGRSUZ_H02125 [Eucalyptus grandis]